MKQTPAKVSHISLRTMSNSPLIRTPISGTRQTFTNSWIFSPRCQKDHHWSEHRWSHLLSVCWLPSRHPSDHSSSGHLHQWYDSALHWTVTLYNVSTIQTWPNYLTTSPPKTVGLLPQVLEKKG